MQPTIKGTDILQALTQGKARPFTEADSQLYAGAPAGSVILDCFEGCQVIVASNFYIEAVYWPEDNDLSATGHSYIYMMDSDTWERT